MIPELEKPRVTEIQVRMDCNGCVKKIKEALHGINGIYDLYFDFPNQKLTIIGWADPDKIVKAIRKTRKIATICSHIEPTDQSAAPPAEQPEQAPAEGGVPPSEAQNPPPVESPPADATQPPPTEPPKDPPPPENPQPEEKPTPSSVPPDASASQQPLPPGPKDVGEVHVLYQYPPGYGYRYGYRHAYDGNWHRYPGGHGHPPEQPHQPHQPEQPHQPQPVYITHSYNTYRPSPYVTEYQYIHSQSPHTFYNRMDHYNEDYHDNSRNGNITSMFSDENPNACRIV